MRLEWDKYFMLIAKLVAQRSTCLSRKVGCVIVKDKRILATGYNGAPAGAPHCIELGYCFRRKHNLSKDFCRSIHAEQNAIAQAVKMGISINGASCYVTLEPCPTCLKLLSACGIKKVYYELPYMFYKTARDQRLRTIFEEARFEDFRQVIVLSDEIRKIGKKLLEPTSVGRFDDELEEKISQPKLLF